MQDEFIRNTIFEITHLYRVLPRKNEKTMVYEVIYVLLVFSFDPLCLQTHLEYSPADYLR